MNRRGVMKNKSVKPKRTHNTKTRLGRFIMFMDLRLLIFSPQILVVPSPPQFSPLPSPAPALLADDTGLGRWACRCRRGAFMPQSLSGVSLVLQAFLESILRRSNDNLGLAIQCRNPRQWDDIFSFRHPSHVGGWDNRPAALSVHGHPSIPPSRCRRKFRCV